MQEMKSLALVDLDIEELDRRIELAPGAMSAAAWCAQDCAVDCGTVCTEFVTCQPNLVRT